MEWSEIGKTVAPHAPLLGRLLAGPTGVDAGTLIAAALDVEATPEAVAKVLADPGAGAKLQELESRHRRRLEEILLEQSRLQIERERARLQELPKARAAASAGLKGTPASYALAAAVVAGFFWAFWTVSKPTAPTSQAAMLMVGGLISAFTQVVQYHFGSSMGSKAKEALLAARERLTQEQ